MAKKVLSFALALLMIVNVFAVAVSAKVADEAIITLETDDQKPMPNEEVTVTVALQNNYNVHALQIMLAYDKNYYEVVGTSSEDTFTNLLESDGAKFTGLVQSQLDAAAQDEMYAGFNAKKSQFGLVRIGYIWLASLASNEGATATPVFTEKTNLVSFKLRVKSDAPDDGKGVIMVDPDFVVPQGATAPAFDTRSATYVGKGAATISASATEGKLYGLPINVDGAKFEGCVHVAGEAVKDADSVVEADCENAGSYDMVTSCTLCSEELTRETVKVDALGHTDGEATIENKTDADCVNNGSYDTVVYCTVCGKEVSRVTTVVDALGHTPGEEERENEVPATKDQDGSYDKVVYCTVCGKEISRETVIVPATGHDFAPAIEENREEATCTEPGSYDLVVYCTCCGEEHSRETKVIPALGHTEEAAVEKNRVEADCVNPGSYDMIVYCGTCGEELSKESFVIEAKGHSYETTVTDPTCTEKGYTTYTCSACGDTYDADVVEALGHSPAEAVEEDRVEATKTENGSYAMVVRCSVCKVELSRETFVIPALDSLPADYEALNALREEAAAIDRSVYTDDSLAAVDAVLAKITDDKKQPEQGIVDAWATELKTALAGLKRDSAKAKADVKIVLDKESVSKDDVITVTVKLTTNYYVTGVQLPILYDKTLFELVGNEGGQSYLTFDENSSFVNGRYDLSGNSGITKGFNYTSNPETWKTDAAKAQYDYAWITAAFNNNTNTSKPNKLAMPKDETFVTFQVKALADVEDAKESIFISPDWTKTKKNTAGTFALPFSDKEVNTNPVTYVSAGMTYTVETIVVEGVEFTGTVQSFATSTDNGEELTTIELIVDGEVKYSTTVAGVGVQNFAISGVEAGTYTVKVSKLNHATRVYEGVEIKEALEMDLKIHLKGDINGDGAVKAGDYAKALSHVKKIATLEGYDLACADINDDGAVKAGDYAKALSHVKKIAYLW